MRLNPRISFSAAIRACEDDARWPQALCLFEDICRHKAKLFSPSTPVDFHGRSPNKIIIMEQGQTPTRSVLFARR